MRVPSRFALTVVAAFVLLPAQAETVMQKANRDGLLFAKKGDVRMKEAFAKAQQTLPGFIAALDGEVAGAETFSVKIPITDNGQTEYFWVNDLSHKDNQLSGGINNRPEIVHNVEFGQQISFPGKRVRDWGYYLAGKLQGNFSTCVLLAQEDAAEAQELKDQIGLSCQ